MKRIALGTLVGFVLGITYTSALVKWLESRTHRRIEREWLGTADRSTSATLSALAKANGGSPARSDSAQLF